MSLSDRADLQIGRVNYIDFRKQFAGPYDRPFAKRTSLKHECEVRAVIRDPLQNGPAGHRIKCSLPALIEAVVVSPFSDDWFYDTVTAAVERLEVPLVVKQSELRDEPFY